MAVIVVPSIVPANVTFAPLNVAAVVVPDLIIRFPELFVALPKVVPSSLKNTSPPPASKTISVVASKVTVEPLSISVSVATLPNSNASAAELTLSICPALPILNDAPRPP